MPRCDIYSKRLNANQLVNAGQLFVSNNIHVIKIYAYFLSQKELVKSIFFSMILRNDYLKNSEIIKS